MFIFWKYSLTLQIASSCSQSSGSNINFLKKIKNRIKKKKKDKTLKLCGASSNKERLFHEQVFATVGLKGLREQPTLTTYKRNVNS